MSKMVYNFLGTRQIVTGTFLSFLTVHFVKKNLIKIHLLQCLIYCCKQIPV